MQEVIAGVEEFTFTFQKEVEMQKDAGLRPFQVLDKSGSAVCNFFAKGLCKKGKLVGLGSGVMAPTGVQAKEGPLRTELQHLLRVPWRAELGPAVGDGASREALPLVVVCKHWLRGLCKKGHHCEFLHQYNIARTPQCSFYSKFGDCNNKECPFFHVKPAFRSQDCPWSDQGFCKNGPLCKYCHVPGIMCFNYLVSFCPEGPRCQFAQ
ncbi:putative cleavage and polyadenylation specificity factor subunit 4-like protein [Nycticebus coucang]|uniref:putative cleavage and polyadenylation specificity factor subunit 4-like protein n=1 Tax=Nycticebus coucang TaxID=9470 RepID=UPI00234D9A92|nr:putative cleavage and polyadenylation specificity factor subunit 4-like protein [Nycticebus coucang]